MRSTHQPKSTIFALLARAAVLLSRRQKRRIKPLLSQKLFKQRTKMSRKVRWESKESPFEVKRIFLYMITGLRKWREGDHLVTMWVNEGRLPLNVNI